MLHLPLRIYDHIFRIIRFWIGNKGNGAKNILPNITDISVYIVSPGIAEVRGLTIYGNNSRWGPAIRSKKDLACWTGSDFEVCAY
jgi:hypothetical protein